MNDPFASIPEAATPVLDLEETGSTNAQAVRLSLKGETGPLWVTARKQSEGRGRQGRDWMSPEGNLFASLLVTLRCQPTEIPGLSILAGVALANAINALLPGRPDGHSTLPRLKWPNDLMMTDAKMAGILVETTSRPADLIAAILGFGVNLAHAPDIPGRPTTCLGNHGVNADPSQVLGQLDGSLRQTFATLSKPAGFDELRRQWLLHGPDLGSPLTISHATQSVVGTFSGLADDGALLIKTATGQLKRITFGDVEAASNRN
ncbi:MAG: biotin--[acetyl-CoA-carboxylase] ligase [Alphaproteobacteria bacterium]|nr:biotin--[acetyl-CoA-carboxylase] ligase [Alphaproteobacteria bacterium]